MNEFLEVVERILGAPLTGWALATVLALYLLRNKLATLWDQVLTKLGTIIGGAWSYRRFDPEYRRILGENHLRLKLVGIRTEEARRPKITDAYVPLSLVPALTGGIADPLSIEQIIAEHKYILILGDPGAGKTTLLDHIIVDSTTPPPSRSFLQRFLTACGNLVAFLLRLRSARQRILPFYLPLRRCKSANKTLTDDLMDPDADNLPLAIRQRMPRGYFATALTRDDTLLLLDGLDELESGVSYKRIVEKINDFVQLYPAVRVVITCRKAGWAGGLEGDFQFFSTLPLDVQQQTTFVRRWYAAVRQVTQFELSESQRATRAASESERLLELLQTKERMREVASNPLILSLICLVHWQKKNLPRGRTALYSECLQILLDLWDRIDKDWNEAFPSFDQKKQVLRRIAYRMHVQGMREVQRPQLISWVLEFLPESGTPEGAARLVRDIEIRSGVISERAIDQLAFSHLTLQEYLVVDYFQNEPGAKLDIASIKDWSKWREPILMLVGASTSSTGLVRELYRQQPMLAIDAIGEIDPANLEVQETMGLLEEFVHHLGETQYGVEGAVRPLVSLFGLEGRPFDDFVLGFISKYFNVFGSLELSSLVEVLCKSPTEETAEFFLRRLVDAKDGEVRKVLLTGLARIGGLGPLQARKWCEDGRLPAELYFDVLLKADTPEATEALWDLCGVSPPKGQEEEWAVSWATRLASTQNEAIVRARRGGVETENDVFVWPYRTADGSALVAIVNRCVKIIGKGSWRVRSWHQGLEVLRPLAMKVRVPLIIEAVERAADSDLKAMDLWVYLPWPAHELRKAWQLLPAYLEWNTWRRKKRVVFATHGIGWASGLMTLVLGFLAMQRLVLSNGNYWDAWSLMTARERIWLLIPVIVGYIVAGIMARNEFNRQDGKVEWRFIVPIGLVLSVAAYVAIASPLFVLWCIVFASVPKLYESAVTFGIEWSWPTLGILQAAVLLVVASGYAAYLVADAYGAYTGGGPWVAGIIVGFLVLVSVYSFSILAAFSQNAWARWLRSEPGGGEVLAEFAGARAAGLANG